MELHNSIVIITGTIIGMAILVAAIALIANISLSDKKRKIKSLEKENSKLRTQTYADHIRYVKLKSALETTQKHYYDLAMQCKIPAEFMTQDPKSRKAKRRK